MVPEVVPLVLALVLRMSALSTALVALLQREWPRLEVPVVPGTMPPPPPPLRCSAITTLGAGAALLAALALAAPAVVVVSVVSGENTDESRKPDCERRCRPTLPVPPLLLSPTVVTCGVAWWLAGLPTLPPALPVAVLNPVGDGDTTPCPPWVTLTVTAGAWAPCMTPPPPPPPALRPATA